jgi:hypothetical protein
MASKNPVAWFEIHGKDGKKVQKFYSDLFGWKVDASNPLGYGMVEAGEGGIGGGLTGSDQAPRVTVYVQVDDLAASLKKAETLGGKTVLPPTAVPNGPNIAMFADPEGNVIGIMKAQA